MKKLLTITAVGALLTAPATAVQKCVALDVGTECRADWIETGSIYWNSWCNYGTSSEIPVKGIGVCAQDMGYGSNDVITDSEFFVVNSDATSVNLTDCWCRVLTPFVSDWVLSGSHSDSLSCLKHCANNCATGVEQYGLLDEILVNEKSKQ